MSVQAGEALQAALGEEQARVFRLEVPLSVIIYLYLFRFLLDPKNLAALFSQSLLQIAIPLKLWPQINGCKCKSSRLLPEA